MMTLAAADPVVAEGFHEAGPNGGYPPDYPAPALLKQFGPMLVARITAVGSFDRAQFTRIAVVEFDGEPDPSERPPAYTVYSWTRGDE
jgi:hypothetical protein